MRIARNADYFSTAASPRISSSIPAPGSASARCGSPVSPRWRRWRRTSSGRAKLKAQCGGSSSGHATRALLLAEPASVDGGEITDKGYINQRAVLTRRAAAVAVLEDDASTEWIGCAG